MYYIGIDIGSVACKGILFKNGIIDKSLAPTGWNPQKSGEQTLNYLLEANNLQAKDIEGVVATGYGRVSQKFADKTVTEITCHGKGGYYLNNEIRTIIDIGGQDSKVISLNEAGQVVDFVMNDKCAAGTGKFLEMTINSLEEQIDNLDGLIKGEKKANISSMCAVFAESEIISLLADGVSKSEIAGGIIDSIINRINILLSKVAFREKVLFTGGLAQSQVIKNELSKKLETKVLSYADSQFAGAIGGALIASNLE
ncbi:MAG: acyl-CoA dehydratase activase [Bacillota bacterium]